MPGRPVLVRAFNVLRQYEEADVAGIWRLVQGRLAPGGLFIDGTCDEIGRRVTWVALDAERPLSLSMSMRFGSFELPSEVAERLPKALIHRNVPGRDGSTACCRPWTGPGWRRRRWRRSETGSAGRPCAGALLDGGWPVQDGPARWRLGELTVGWEAVAPGT